MVLWLQGFSTLAQLTFGWDGWLSVVRYCALQDGSIILDLDPLDASSILHPPSRDNQKRLQVLLNVNTLGAKLPEVENHYYTVMFDRLSVCRLHKEADILENIWSPCLYGRETECYRSHHLLTNPQQSGWTHHQCSFVFHTSSQ